MISVQSLRIHHCWFQSSSPKSNLSRPWGIIKSLNRKRAETPLNQPITFFNKSLTRNVEIATAFAKQFTFSSKSLTRNVEIATAFAKQFTSALSHSSGLSARMVRRKLHNRQQTPRNGDWNFPPRTLPPLCSPPVFPPGRLPSRAFPHRKVPS